MRANEFLGQASCITRSAVDQHATQSSSDHAIAETNDQSDREKLIADVGLRPGLRCGTPIVTAPGMQLLIFKGRAELLPPKPGETLPGYDTLEFKIARSCVNGQEVDHIVCEGVVVEPPKRRAERLTTGAAVT